MKRFLCAAALVGLVAVGCGNGGGNTPMGMTADPSLTGAVVIDGSSTVFPVTAGTAELFKHAFPNVNVTIGMSGTGGGFKRFVAGETDISNASRPISQSEIEKCKANNIEYVELPVAYDGIVIVVNKKNTWLTEITVEQLKKIWEPAAKGEIMKWSQVDPSWPDKEIKLFGPGVDSGTFEYFTEAICHTKKDCRSDYTPSENDNVLVQGVATEEFAMGYFGIAYYEKNQDKLNAVKVNDGNEGNGAGAIAPSAATVEDGTYQPLSRPIFIYVKKSSLDQPAVAKFVEFYLQQAPTVVPRVGYVLLPGNSYELAQKRAADKKVGTVFGGAGATIGVKMQDLLTKEGQ